jgi:uncharacterized protein DUF4440
MKRKSGFAAICLCLGFAISGLTGSDRALAQKTYDQILAEREAMKAELHTEELYNLEKGNARAIQLGNSTFVNATYSDDCSSVTWYGEVLSKEQLVRQIQTSQIRYIQVTESNIEIKAYQNVAAVSSLRSERGTLDGKPVARQFRVLRVYVNANRSWHVVAQQETQLPSSTSR